MPLALPAIDLLNEIWALSDSDKLLASRGDTETGPSGFSKAMARLRRAMETQMGRSVQHWTLHDLRRTVATGLQRLGVRLEVTEAILNHVSGSRAGIVGVYQRHNYFEEKKAALEAWGDELIRLAACHPLNPKLPRVRQRRSSDTMVALGKARGEGARRSAAGTAMSRS